MPERSILHVDMDAFFAAVEVRDDPSLAGRPLIVGGSGRRGVVASCSYEARSFGIRSAMPSARARALCPQAVFLAGRYDRYQEVSADLHSIFDDYTPLVEGIALDEAFLDVTGSIPLLGPARHIAEEIRSRVVSELGLTCSVGIAPSKFLAKLASEAAKPMATREGVRPGAGVFVIDSGDELAFLHPLPVEALWGVGPATSARLRNLGLATIGDLSAVDAAALEAAVGRSHGRHLHSLAHAVDLRPVEPSRAAKSVGHEETYATDRYGLEELGTELLRMADAVAARLRDAGVAGRTVTVKVRYGDFKTLTRRRTVAEALDSGREVASVARELLSSFDLSLGVRLLGVSVSGLGPRCAGVVEQLTLALEADPAGDAPRSQRPLDVDAGRRPGQSRVGAPDRPGWGAAADAVEAVRRRFGAASVGPAALVGPTGLRTKRSGDTQWGPADPAG